MKFFVTRSSRQFYKQPCATSTPENGRWAIEINSLEELISFVDSQGDIIVREHFSLPGKHYEIEIYDGWRE